MAAAIGTLGQLGIHTASPVTVRYDFLREALIKDENLIDSNGVRGTRSRHSGRLRGGLQRIAGSILLEPNATEMALLLPWILGGTPAGVGPTTYPLADTLTARYVVIDRITKVFTYTGVKVDRATFRSRQGEPLELELELVGMTETVGNAGTFPSLTIAEANYPWVMSDLALTCNAVTVTPPDFELVIDNFIDRERFFNGRTLASVETLDREVTLTCNPPYGDQSALYDAAGGNTAGVSGSAVFTSSAGTLTMTLTKIFIPPKSPSIPGRQEVMLPLVAKVFRTDGAAEIIVTL